MNTFLSIFIFFYSLYGTAHLYTFLKIRYTFHTGTSENILLGLFLLIMMFTPSFVRFCSLRSSETVSRTIAYIAYSWMAFLLFFFSCSILMDIYNLGIRFAGYIFQKNLDGLTISALPAFYASILLAVPLSIYSYYEARKLQANKITLKTSKLPEGVNKLTIAHISDLHLGIMVSNQIVDKIAEEIKKAAPDIIVATGDLLEEEVDHIVSLSEKLKKLHAGLGKFAVTGNHDFFTDISQSVRFIKNSGFILLRGEGLTVQNTINIAGIDDPISKNTKDQVDSPSEIEILSGLPSNIFTLLLKHRPDIDKNSLGLFDLQLSGHTHGGQFLPLRFLLKLFFNYESGYRTLPEGSAIHVSRGAGTACSPIRFLSPPEVTFIELVSETAK